MLDNTNSLLPGNPVTTTNNDYVVKTTTQGNTGTINIVANNHYVLDHTNNIYIIKYV